MSESPSAGMVSEPAPNELRDPFVRKELTRATVWLGTAGAIALVVLLVHPLLIIFGGLVFASMLDGGVRLLGRVLPIGRSWRLMIVVLLTVAFLVGLVWLTGVQVTAQFAQLQQTLITQATRTVNWATAQGIMPKQVDINGMMQQVLGSFGQLTSYLGIAFGALASLVMVLVIGLFVAIEPRLYGRGVEWMVPTERLFGMALEGAMTGVALAIAGVPMALVLGILTGLLAFIPNLGAIVSGILMVAVGFSAGMDTGLYAIGIYVFIQALDGYVIIPMVAKKTVDLPPALTLSSQILAGTLFGLLGLTLADPMTAMIKVALERSSEAEEQADAA
jgi:predicted PurR-regulated permease PerM